jgi:hypothetical protein
MTFAQQQHKTRPKIEDVIPTCVDVDKQQAVFDFVAHMRANKMNPVWSGTFNTWKFNYKGKCICKISLPDNAKHAGPDCSWIVTPSHEYSNEYAETITSEGLQSIFWDNIFYCVLSGKSPCSDGNKKCFEGSRGCAGGRTKQLIGKEFTNICLCCPIIEFRDPTPASVEIIKRLLELEQAARDAAKI